MALSEIPGSLEAYLDITSLWGTHDCDREELLSAVCIIVELRVSWNSRCA